MPAEIKKKIEKLEALAKRTTDQESELIAARAKLQELATMQTSTDVVAKENDRIAGIYKVCALYKVEDTVRVDALADKAIDAQALKDTMLLKLSAGSKHDLSVKMDTDAPDSIKVDVANALAMRAGLTIEKPSARAEEYKHATLVDIGKALLKADGHTVPANRMDSVRASMSTSDLPTLLIDTGRKVVAQEAKEYPTTYQILTGIVNTPDFNTTKELKIGDLGVLDLHHEKGTPKYGEVSEDYETFQSHTFTKLIGMTREMIFGDQFGHMMEVIRGGSKMAERTKDALFYSLLRSGTDIIDHTGYTMRDGLPIFHASHNNLANSPLTAQSLSEARVAIATQKLQNGATAYLQAQTLVVGHDLEDTAIMLVGSPAVIEDNKSSGVVNVHYKKFEVVVSPLVGAGEWYVMASERSLKMVQMEGAGNAPIITQTSISELRRDYEIVSDFGAFASDYRGLYKGQ